MILENVWKVVAVGEAVTVFGKDLAMASYYCHLCKAPVLTKHTVVVFSPTATKQ